MNQRIENLKEYILDKKHHQYRRTPESLGIAALNETFHREQVAPGRPHRTDVRRHARQ